MNQEEMQVRCKKGTIITESDVWAVSPIYCLLNFDKDDFCKLIDAIGLDKWTAAANRWKRLDKADQMLQNFEQYERNRERLEAIERERESLEQERERLQNSIAHYERQTGVAHRTVE